MAQFNGTTAFMAGLIGLGGFVLIKGAVNGVWGRVNPSGNTLEQSVGNGLSGIGVGGN
tara:strand:- start:52 stop:225 length:174 start_codon:yes stop_codon:yes gene_type:complete